MLCPFFLTILFIEISSSFVPKILFVLSNTISTDASFDGDATFVPMKRRLLAFAALIDFILSLPKTKQSASVMFDFPDPFGPKITFIPGVKGSSVFLGKLLNPCITNFFT